MTARPRPRCPSGHFLPADGGPCRCQLYSGRGLGMTPDLYGQRIRPGARIKTLSIPGRYL